MARSLLRQLEQIRRAATYDDDVASANTSAVAEPTVSGSLEQDTNIFRTLLKQMKGTTNWYDDPGKYLDPTNTDGSNTANKQMSLANIKGNTLDSKTIILAVTADNGGVGYSVSTGTSGVLLTTTTRYATAADRTGLPIYFSAGGTYIDEGADNNVVRVDVVNVATDSEIVDGSGNVIFGKFHDGLDFGGAGTGTDAYIRFYSGSGDGTVTTLPAGISKVSFVYPYRKRLSDVEEYEWLRTDFINSWEGDVELIEDISNLWAFTGASNDNTNPAPWTNVGAGYLLTSNPSNLKAAIDLLNDGIGAMNFTSTTYLVGDTDVAVSLIDLDAALKAVADQIAAGIGEKYVESVGTLITKNTDHDISALIGSYTPFSDGGREGKNMDVYIDGQLLAADTGVAGADQNRDYAETSTTTVKFRFDIQVGRNITYVVRQ
jgi:hypothetical protein